MGLKSTRETIEVLPLLFETWTPARDFCTMTSMALTLCRDLKRQCTDDLLKTCTTSSLHRWEQRIIIKGQWKELMLKPSPPVMIYLIDPSLER